MTLVVDVGGTGIKTIVLSESDQAVTERIRVPTPVPSTPEAIFVVIAEMARQQGKFDRVTVGFPGVVRRGVTETAHNLDPSWIGLNLEVELEKVLGKPVRAANDADVQGFGAIKGHGVELVITLGTGFGCALFVDGTLVPNLEIAHHPAWNRKTYEQNLGNAALQDVGRKKWNSRLAKAIRHLEALFNYDLLYIGGGNAKDIRVHLPANVQIIPNTAGLFGGIALWRTKRELSTRPAS